MEFQCFQIRIIGPTASKSETQYEFRFSERNNHEMKIRLFGEDPTAYQVGSYYKLTLEEV